MAASAQHPPLVQWVRRAVFATYLTAAVGYSSMVIFSVFRSVSRHSPGRPLASAAPAEMQYCTDSFRALFDELDAKRHAVRQIPAATIEQVWMDFRLQWLQRKRALETACAVDAKGRESLAVASGALESVLDASTTHVIQFAGQLAPLEERFRSALERIP
jgi:hypothetical protein